MGKVIIKEVKSGIDRDKNQKLTLKALGLRKVYHSVEKENTDQIKGMIEKVRHLVEVTEIK